MHHFFVFLIKTAEDREVGSIRAANFGRLSFFAQASLKSVVGYTLMVCFFPNASCQIYFFIPQKKIKQIFKLPQAV